MRIPFIFLWIFLGLFLSQNAAAQETQNFTAVVGALDKITARITRLELPANTEVAFGNLRLVAKSCYKRPPEEPPETYIYLIIKDHLSDGTEVDVFQGWMLESSPALNAMEHAVYDVWAIDCITSAGGASGDSR